MKRIALISEHASPHKRRNVTTVHLPGGIYRLSHGEPALSLDPPVNVDDGGVPEREDAL